MNDFEKIYRSWFFKVLYGVGLAGGLITFGYDSRDFFDRPVFEGGGFWADIIFIGLGVLYFASLCYIKHKTTLNIVMSAVFGGYILFALYNHFMA